VFRVVFVFVFVFVGVSKRDGGWVLFGDDDGRHAAVKECSRRRFPCETIVHIPVMYIMKRKTHKRLFALRRIVPERFPIRMLTRAL